MRWIAGCRRECWNYLGLTILIQWIDLNRSVRKLQLKINKDNNSCFQHGSIQHLLERNFCAYTKRHSFGFLFDAFFYSHFVTLYERTEGKKKPTQSLNNEFCSIEFQQFLKAVTPVRWHCFVNVLGLSFAIKKTSNDAQLKKGFAS